MHLDWSKFPFSKLAGRTGMTADFWQEWVDCDKTRLPKSRHWTGLTALRRWRAMRQYFYWILKPVEGTVKSVPVTNGEWCSWNLRRSLKIRFGRQVFKTFKFFKPDGWMQGNTFKSSILSDFKRNGCKLLRISIFAYSFSHFNGLSGFRELLSNFVTSAVVIWLTCVYSPILPQQ